MFPSIGTGELLMILLVALVVIGPKKLPTVIKTVAKVYKYIRKASAEITSSINEAANDTKETINEQKESLSDYFGEIEDFDDIDTTEPKSEKGDDEHSQKEQQPSDKQS